MKNEIMEVIELNIMAQLLESLEKNGWLEGVIPCLAHTVGLEQNIVDYHCYDVFKHIVAVAYAAQHRFPGNKVLLACGPLHDVAKGWTIEQNGVQIRTISPKNNQPQDIGHEEVGAPVAYKTAKEWGFVEREALLIEFVTKFHGIRLEWNPKKTTVAHKIREFIKEFGTKEKPLFTNKEELAEGIELLFDFMLCDADGFKEEFGKNCRMVSEAVRVAFREVLNETAFFTKDVEVSQDELLVHGATEKQVEEIFKKLLDLNKYTRNEAVQFIEKKYQIAL